MGRENGLSESMLQALPSYATSSLFSAKEKVALQLGDQMTALPVVVDDAFFTLLQSHFSQVELLELMSCIAWENYRARFNHAMAIGSDDYSKGSFCPMPASLACPAQASQPQCDNKWRTETLSSA